MFDINIWIKAEDSPEGTNKLIMKILISLRMVSTRVLFFLLNSFTNTFLESLTGLGFSDYSRPRPWCSRFMELCNRVSVHVRFLP